jgi:ATP-dependent DNA ligase
MLARLARELPVGTDVVYEPKWDGFRCLAFCERDDIDLRSRNDRPLSRYFSEVVSALRTLPRSAVIDGELVVAGDEGSDFATLMSRLHPAASRAERLAAEHPATFIAFDLLAEGSEVLLDLPQRARRERLERLLAHASEALSLTPATTDVSTANGWLRASSTSAIDGVVAKDAAAPYEPGRRALVKVKLERTADCIVAGVRPFGDQSVVGSLLLGLFDGGTLLHVGVASSFTMARRRELVEELAPLNTPLRDHPWRHGFALEGGPMGRLGGAAARWSPEMAQDWVPLRLERVAEVSYTQLDGIRFRHPARFCRWRPDRDAASCTVEQLVAA